MTRELANDPLDSVAFSPVAASTTVVVKRSTSLTNQDKLPLTLVSLSGEEI
jgi:hypothetical protein